MNAILTDARRGHPGLFVLAVVMAALAVVCAGLAIVDQRTLLGAAIWHKPLKFAISIAAYSMTAAWLLGVVARARGHDARPPFQRLGWLMVITLAVEIVIIVGQAARAVPSHFNDDGGLGELLWNVMGTSIVVFFLAVGYLAARMLREPGLDPVLGTAIRAGLAVSLVGMAVAFTMPPLSSHSVGVPDGGSYLPLLGWSTEGGDLRVGHFVGLHAVQVLPLLAAVLTALSWYDALARRQAVLVAATVHAGLVVLLTWQALRGQPLVAPDATTLAALTVLVVGGLVALALVRGAAVRRAAVDVAAPPAR